MFSPLSLVGVLLAASLLGNVVLWKTASHEREQRAVAEASARQWQATAKECSDATVEAADAAKRKQTASKKALDEARSRNQGTEAEIARLRQSSAGTCVEAVKTVRDGLSQK